MDGEARQTTVHGVAKSRTRLSGFTLISAQTPVLQGPTPSPSLCTACSTDLSRRPPRPPCVCSHAAPSPGKGTSTRGTPFLCSSGRPAKCALIPPRSEQTSWRLGLLHSPAACTPRGHRPGPSRHHRWCPRSPAQGSPLSRRSDRPRPPGGAVCCLRREKWDNGELGEMGQWGTMERVFCPVGPSPEQQGALSSEDAESAGSDKESHWGRTWVWFPAGTAMIRELLELAVLKHIHKIFDATSTSILAWRIPWTEEPVRLLSTGSHIVGHN